MLLNIVTIGAFVVLAAVIYILGQLLSKLTHDPIRDRLEALTKSEIIGNNSALLEGLSQQLPHTTLDNGVLDREIRRAGYYHRGARTEFLALRNGLVLLAVVGAGIGAVIAGPERSRLAVQIMMGGFLAAMLAWAIPRVMLRAKGSRRAERITESLPFALDMITMSLSGGLSLRDSLFHVSREIYFAHPELAVELLIIRQQAELSSLEMAFEQFGRRVDTPEVTSMASLISQGQRLGTDVVNSINEYAESLRVKRRQLADAQSSRAAVYMLFPLTMCMVPAVMIVLWGPALLQLIEFIQTFEGAGAFSQ